MSDITVKVEEDGIIKKILGDSPKGIERDLKDAVDDIADRIEEYAGILAPEDTGHLKEHPVDRSDRSGKVTGIALFGGGVAIRGEGGQFVKGVGTIPGRTVSHIEITVASEPEYAIWVHEGTGVFGPHATPIVSPTGGTMVFEIDGRKFYRKSVLGQPPQPYLTEAFEYVDRTFVPKRIEQLRVEIDAAFK